MSRNRPIPPPPPQSIDLSESWSRIWAQRAKGRPIAEVCEKVFGSANPDPADLVAEMRNRLIEAEFTPAELRALTDFVDQVVGGAHRSWRAVATTDVWTSDVVEFAYRFHLAAAVMLLRQPPDSDAYNYMVEQVEGPYSRLPPPSARTQVHCENPSCREILGDVGLSSGELIVYRREWMRPPQNAEELSRRFGPLPRIVARERVDPVLDEVEFRCRAHGAKWFTTPDLTSRAQAVQQR